MPLFDLLTKIESAARVLKQGGVVVFPTETVYGLGAVATNPLAVAKIYEIKGRPLEHPLIVHAENTDGARRLVREWPDEASLLADAFWPGPLTIILPKSSEIPSIVTGGMDSVGIRVPAHPVAQRLIQLAGPLAAPSANFFGEISATRPEHLESLRDKVDFILPAGASDVGVESTIVSLLDKKPMLLRPGGISREEIEKVLGEISTPEADAKAIAPGMLAKHYAPTTRVFFQSPGEPLPAGSLGLLCFEDPPEAQRDAFRAHVALSPKGDLREAAAELFSALRTLDALKLDGIVAHPFPAEGLGVAINDRLKRAST